MDNKREQSIRELGSLFNNNPIPYRKPEENIRICTNCGRRLLRDSKNNLCPMCEEQRLFSDVRDYIRANDVKDYDVAEKFGIPVAKVKQWIKQGRIQYKNDSTMKNVIMGNYCQVCGTPTSFGTICPKCMKEEKKKNIQGVAIGKTNSDANTRMRFMEDKDKK